MALSWLVRLASILTDKDEFRFISLDDLGLTDKNGRESTINRSLDGSTYPG
jgi:hypothetical protein